MTRIRKEDKKEKVEYTRPVPLNTNEQYGDVELLLNMYGHIENEPEDAFKIYTLLMNNTNTMECHIWC